jgi:hypothetical protein
MDQSPCEVAAQLIASSLGEDSTLDPPDPGPRLYINTYHEAWSCNMPFYSLMAACADCQADPWETWETWTTSCLSTFDTFESLVPTTTIIPGWANLDFLVRRPYSAIVMARALMNEQAENQTGYNPDLARQYVINQDDAQSSSSAASSPMSSTFAAAAASVSMAAAASASSASVAVAVTSAASVAFRTTVICVSRAQRRSISHSYRGPACFIRHRPTER